MTCRGSAKIEFSTPKSSSMSICLICRKLMPNGTFKEIQSQQIKVGDIIKVSHSQRIPMDMVLIKSSDKSGGAFVKTDQLDGETDWKFRESIPQLQHISNLKELYENPI